ncbi:HGGxSTG domain-containing protein [Halomicrobium sp. HM KBTZ05]|uniref:HGGxSTG domain-containing protein n=1 Tax=Halomicrobium sp. HM KBTZ05 TaxID=3242663 RepID=UPI003558D1AF
MEYGEHGRCEAQAKTTGERCKRAAIGEHGKCDKHGGKSTGPKDTAHLEGNDHAEGNDGGSPPEGNMNALQTGLHADPVKLFDWLLEADRDAAVWILNKLYGYSQDAPKPVYEATLTPTDVDTFEDAQMNLTAYGDDVLLMCIRDYARWKATKQQLQDGILKDQTKATDDGPISVEDSNPVNLDLDRMDKTTIRQKDKLGLLPSPAKEEAEAKQDLGTLVAEKLQEE